MCPVLCGAFPFVTMLYSVLTFNAKTPQPQPGRSPASTFFATLTADAVDVPGRP